VIELMNKRTVVSRLEQERERLLKMKSDLEGQPDGTAGAAAGELADYDQHPADIGTEAFEQEKNLSILESVDEQLKDVDAAFERLERGTYGTCEACGKPIEPARLEQRPFARFCLQDQQRIERGVGLPGSAT
jgi:RNA polymerase-binding transcription factor DksA